MVRASKVLIADLVKAEMQTIDIEGGYFKLFSPSTWDMPARSDLETQARNRITTEQNKIATEQEQTRKEAEAKRILKNAQPPKSKEEEALDLLEKSIANDVEKAAEATTELKKVNARLNVIQAEAQETNKTVNAMAADRERQVKKYAEADDFQKRNLEMDILDLEEALEDENENLKNANDHLAVLSGSAQALKLDIRNTNRRIRQHRSKLRQGRSLVSTRKHVGNVDGHLRAVSDEASMDNINLLIEEVKGDINERLNDSPVDANSRVNATLRLQEEAAALTLAAPVQEDVIHA